MEAKLKKKLALLNIATLVGLCTFLVHNYYSAGFVSILFSGDSTEFLTYFDSKDDLFRYGFVILLVIVEVIIGVIPGALIYPFIGLLIGPLAGSLLVLVGNIIGSIANYYQGKLIWNGLNELDEKSSRLMHKFEDHGVRTLFLLRLNPLTSFDFFPYLAGGSGMRFWPFFFANTLGLLPLIIIGTYLGKEVLTEYDFALQALVIITIVYVAFAFIRYRSR